MIYTYLASFVVFMYFLEFLNNAFLIIMQYSIKQVFLYYHLENDMYNRGCFSVYLILVVGLLIFLYKNHNLFKIFEAPN